MIQSIIFLVYDNINHNHVRTDVAYLSGYNRGLNFFEKA